MAPQPKLKDKWQFDKIKELYIESRWSINKICKKSERLLGIKAGFASVRRAIKDMGLDVRGIAENVSDAMSELDVIEKLETEDMVEWIDGFNLGDGYISFRTVDGCLWRGARYVIGTVEKEWCEYAISKFSAYRPSPPKQYGKIRDKAPRLAWSSRTLTHPDIIKQAQRWYPNGKKIVPPDVRITPISLLLWYLGDGSITKSGISYTIRFATCSFDPDDINNILIPKLEALGLEAWIDGCGKNDIKMSTKSTNKFFDIIGHKSPISCYNYKFEFHQWLTLKRLSEVVPDRNIRWRVQYMFKRGKLDCTLSPGGKMILFTPDQEKKLLDILNGRSEHENYKEEEVIPYKGSGSDTNNIKLSDIVKTPNERWNARYLMTMEKVESLKGSLFTSEQAKVLRQKLDQYGETSVIPDKDIERYFREARSWGFPHYDLSRDKFTKGVNTLKNAQIVKNEGVYNWAGNGSEMASVFHPHMFECKSKGNMSAIELFNSDEDFKRAIWKVTALYGKITKSNIREICRNEKASSRINQFPPRVTMAVLKELYPNGGIKYLDPTHGFSGRLIGSYCSELVDKYVGIDLSKDTHNGALKTVEWMQGLSNMKVDLLEGDCLDIMPKIDNDFDLIFTSPPFLDIERYKGVPFQTDYSQWMDTFISPFCYQCFRNLKSGGKLAVYLEKIGGHDFRNDFSNIALKEGFLECSPVLFKASYGENNRDKSVTRGIPVLVFEKGHYVG